jgi:predicted Zn-dependent peptidase
MVKVKKTQQGIITATEYLQDTNIIALNIAVRNGSRHETVENNGISHFLEHMAFKGTKNRTALKIAEEFDCIGGVSNAYTSRTETVYYTKVLKEYESQMYEIMGDIFNNSIFLAEEMELERKVILQEIKMNNDSPEDVIFEKMFQTIFKDQSLGLKITGTEENVNRFQRDDLEQYYQQNYLANNTVIAVVGDFEQKKFDEDFVSKFALGQNNAKLNSEEVQFHAADLHLDKDLEQVQMLLCFAGVSYLDPDYWACKILSMILGGGMSSRLFQEVREKRGLTYNISSFPYCFADIGLFVIHASLEAQNMRMTMDVIIQELHDVMQKITAAELAKAKAQFKSALFMSMENSDIRAERLSGYILRYGKYVSVNEVMTKINNVTEQSIIYLAKRIFMTEKIGYFTLGRCANRYGYEKILAKFVK